MSAIYVGAVRAPAEMRAASCVISARSFASMGLASSCKAIPAARADFAQSLISGAEALKGL